MLALVGSGEYLPPMEPVDRFLLDGLKAPGRVICLATAAGAEGPARLAYWSELGKAHFSKLGAEVESLPVIDAPSANNPEFAGRIRQANFIYLSGGKPDYLYRTLEGSLVWQAILDVLSGGGVVAGCSAGAMVMGERYPSFPHTKQAFGLVQGVIIMPHFDEIPSAMKNTLHMLMNDQHTLLGIEGNTALVGERDQWQVVGRGGVVVWNKHGKRRYTQGEMVKWVIPGG